MKLYMQGLEPDRIYHNGKIWISCPVVTEELGLHEGYFYVAKHRLKNLNFYKPKKTNYIDQDSYNELEAQQDMRVWFIAECNLFFDYLCERFGWEYVKKKLGYKYYQSTFTDNFNYSPAIRVFVKFRMFIRDFDKWKDEFSSIKKGEV